MRTIKGIKYLNVDEIYHELGGRISKEGIIERLSNESIDEATNVPGQWHLSEESTKFLKGIFTGNLDISHIYTIPDQNIKLQEYDFNPDGMVLDIGGGGAATISRWLPNYTVPIDIKKNELDLVPNQRSNYRLVMNATKMGFDNDSFGYATSFFSLMYIGNNKKSAFEEIHRVLRPDGDFHIWDIPIPNRRGQKKEMALVKVSTEIGFRTDTYAVINAILEQSLEGSIKLAQKTGFRIEHTQTKNEMFYMKLKKE